MTQYFGDYSEDATVYIPFNTFTSDDPAASATITNLADADIKVHKDGSATEIVTDGATVAIDFDGVTGNHLITINTAIDAAYATGSDYLVRIEGTTIDAGAINAWVGSFSIENRHAAAGSTPPTAAAIADAVWDEDIIAAHNTAATAGKIVGDNVNAPIGTVDTVVDAIKAVTDNLPDSGALSTIDGNIDAILVDTGTTLENHLTDIKGTGFAKDTHSLVDIETYVDLIDDGTSGLAKIATDVAAVLVDTADMQPKLGTPAADVSADIAAVKAETALIVADTGTDGVVVAGTPDVNVAQISGSTTAADNLEASALGIVPGAVNDASATTTTFVADGFTEATDDHFNGRIIVFTSGALAGQASDITDYTGGTQTFTVTALTEAPADNVTFVIV